MKNQAAQALAQKRKEKYPELHTKEYMQKIAKLPRKRKPKDKPALAKKAEKKLDMPFDP
jgi:hypothetical protein